ncbi:MAG: hypothetical protein UW24_C0032G0003 [Parcubacteria group bacterium GW2011_GWA2_44_12]|nr:MAG: hypothetical protein UW24_C0032G0003 [Parcubacteria group bacterium GW2011_GWA2_44_12]
MDKFTDRAAVMDLIKRLGENDLIFLNKLIIERLKLIAQAKSTHHMARFNIGDRVGFRTHDGKKTGIIMRLNKKTISIKTDDGADWNVSPVYLTVE